MCVNCQRSATQAARTVIASLQDEAEHGLVALASAIEAVEAAVEIGRARARGELDVEWRQLALMRDRCQQAHAEYIGQDSARPEAVAAVAVQRSVLWNAIAMLERTHHATPEQRGAVADELRAVLTVAPPSPQPATPTVEQINQELLEALQELLAAHEVGVFMSARGLDKARAAIDAALTKKDEA